MVLYAVAQLYEQHGSRLSLKLVTGEEGMRRKIRQPEVQRPGLGLAGYLKGYADKRILVFGGVELEYLRHLDNRERLSRLEHLLTDKTPAVVVTRRYHPPSEMKEVCTSKGVPLFRTSLGTMNFINKLTQQLNDEFAPTMTCHGTLVEVFGVGVLIRGESAVGKSEAALGLVERGHRLVSDDLVKIRKREDSYLEGYSAGLTQYHMEIRGIGIINVAHLYGAVCVRPRKSIDLVVMLEEWDEHHFYDRIGLEDHFCDLLGVQVNYHVLPVGPGRDVVLLLETLALNHRLKMLGYHSAREFSNKLLDLTAPKRKRASLDEKGGGRKR